MAKDLISIIIDCWNRMKRGSAARVVESNQQPAVQKTDTIVDTESLMAQVAKMLQRYNREYKTDFSKKMLTIYINDSLLYHKCLSIDFEAKLKQYLDEERGYVFFKVEIQQGTVPEGMLANNLTRQVAIVVRHNEERRIATRATITAEEDCGAIVGGTVVLDAAEIEKLPEQRYNIGVGLKPVIERVPLRYNHIALDDDPQSPMFERNRYVSRRHAYIKYNPKIGFTLFVEEGGTIDCGKRTQILRDGKYIEVDNILVPKLLKDKDSIILNHKVQLLFREE